LRPRSLALVAASGLAASLFASCVGAPPPGVALSELPNSCADSLDGALCNDGQPCTVNDACVNKICVGVPVADGTACTDGNLCTINDVCLAAVCVGTVVADGFPCTDDDLCTDPDTCLAGQCHSGPAKSCDDGDPCTVDSCLPVSGCLFTPRDCELPADATADLSMDVASDVISADVPSTEGSMPDGPGSLADGGAGDAQDATADAPEDAAVDAGASPPDLRARGGACNCALADPAPAVAWSQTAFWSLALALALGLRRRRRR
jgi:MYXO-CTERM domain-containing protein